MPFFQHQSSMPRMRTDRGAGQERLRMRRRNVGPETRIPSLGASRFSHLPTGGKAKCLENLAEPIGHPGVGLNQVWEVE